MEGWNRLGPKTSPQGRKRGKGAVGGGGEEKKRREEGGGRYGGREQAWE